MFAKWRHQVKVGWPDCIREIEGRMIEKQGEALAPADSLPWIVAKTSAGANAEAALDL